MPRLVYWPTIGGRVVLAMTCIACGNLRAGDEFDWRPRLPGGVAYLDRRCRTSCRWRTMEQSAGR